MDILRDLTAPIGSIVDLDSMGLVRSAKQQLTSLTIVDLILITDNFTKHDRLNQIGKVGMGRLKLSVINSNEYMNIKHIVEER